jgi:hypothetical protein
MAPAGDGPQLAESTSASPSRTAPQKNRPMLILGSVILGFGAAVGGWTFYQSSLQSNAHDGFPMAIALGDTIGVRRGLEVGKFNPNLKTESGLTPTLLACATKTNTTKVVSILLEHGGDINAFIPTHIAERDSIPSVETSCLTAALARRDTALLALLLSHHVDVLNLVRPDAARGVFYLAAQVNGRAFLQSMLPALEQAARGNERSQAFLETTLRDVLQDIDTKGRPDETRELLASLCRVNPSSSMIVRSKGDPISVSCSHRARPS